MECVLASRPWSFTASIIPITLTSVVLGQSLLSLAFLRVLSMGIFIQAGANLSNTYYDYINGVDSKENIGGDNTLVENRLSVKTMVTLSAICYFLGVLSVFTDIINNTQLLWIFVSGILLAFFYTATPVGLKYQAMGDLTIFICFGPLLMQGTSLVLTGEMNTLLHVYSVPIGLITENILHANNVRDIKVDREAGMYVCILTHYNM